MTLDATQVFDPYEPPVFVGFGQTPLAQPKKRGPFYALQKAQVQQLFMRHSFEVSFIRLTKCKKGKTINKQLAFLI